MSKKILTIAALFLTVISCTAARAGTEDERRTAITAMKKGDAATALPILMRLANAGDLTSMRYLLSFYRNGMCKTKKDPHQAHYWAQRLADRKDGTGLAMVGFDYMLGQGVKKDRQKAFDSCRKSADQGSSLGKLGLACCYDRGWGTPRNPEEAFKYFDMAAKQGNIQAQFNLGECYRQGDGVPVNLEQAKVWYGRVFPFILNSERVARWSANEYELAMMFDNGWGTTQNKDEAQKWYQLALPKLKKEAASGDIDAIGELADASENGFGVAKDAAAAIKFYQSLADQGDAYAKAQLLRLTDKQTIGGGTAAVEVASQALAAAPPPSSQHNQSVESERVEIVPGELSAVIYCRKIATGAPAWIYVTDGLKKAGQDELVLTVIRRDGESDTDYPREPISFFNTVLLLAKQGKLADAGGRMVFSGTRSLVAPQFGGLLCLPAGQIASVNLPTGALAAIPVTREELQVCNKFGATRVAARLSSQSSYYPYPTWCDRTRESVFSSKEIEEMENQPVSHVPTVFLVDASVMAEGKQLSLLVPPSEQNRFVRAISALSPQKAVMLCLGLDPRANAMLTWSSSADAATTATTPPGSDGSKMSGAYLEILPGANTTEYKRFADGYVVMLTTEAWNKLKSCVLAGQDIHLPADSGELETFSVGLPKRVYRNPLNGRSLYASGGWQTYGPHGEVGAALPKDVDVIILLTPDDQLKACTTADAIGGFYKEIEKVTHSQFAQARPEPTTYKIIIQCDVSSGQRAVYQIGVNPPTLASTVIAQLYAKLHSLPVPASKGSFSFQCLFHVRPGVMAPDK